MDDGLARVLFLKPQLPDRKRILRPALIFIEIASFNIIGNNNNDRVINYINIDKI